MAERIESPSCKLAGRLNPGIPASGLNPGIAGPKRRLARSLVLTAPPLPMESWNRNGLVPALSVEFEVGCFKGL
jgi:hypothetical protein